MGKHPLKISLLVCVLFVICGSAHARKPALEIAITSSGIPLATWGRSEDGKMRYKLNRDAMLGASIGLTPRTLDLSTPEVHGGSGIQFSTLPVFSVTNLRSFQTTDQPGMGFHLTLEQKSGSNSDFVSSVSSTLGFSLPLSRRWTLGGAVNLEFVPDSAATIDGHGSTGGAYLGLQFQY